MIRQQTGRFIDAHVHLKDGEGLETIVSAGIAAVRNAGMNVKPGETAAERGSTFVGEPVVLSSCWALFKQGGYGARFGVPVRYPQQIADEIARLKNAGAGIIKVMASGMVSLKKPGTVTEGGFDGEELRFIVQEAARHGLGVMAHANGEPAISAAAAAGVRSVEHGFFMTESALELLRQQGTFWTPTVGALVRAADAAGAPNETKRFVCRLVEEHLQMLQRAWSLGVPLAVGTDCVLPDPRYSEAYEAELAFFEQAGIPSEAVTRIATEGGARLLGLPSSEWGVRSSE